MRERERGRETEGERQRQRLLSTPKCAMPTSKSICTQPLPEGWPLTRIQIPRPVQTNEQRS